MFASRPLCKRCSGSDHEGTRNELGPHERNVRALSLWFWMLGIGSAVAAVSALTKVDRGLANGASLGFLQIVLLLIIPWSALFLVGAWHLPRFTKTGQVLGAVGSALGMVSFPLGTLIGVFALWVLLGKRGQAVFTQEYRAAIAATPQLKYGLSIGTKVALGLLVLVAILAGMMAR